MLPRGLHFFRVSLSGCTSLARHFLPATLTVCRSPPAPPTALHFTSAIQTTVARFSKLFGVLLHALLLFRSKKSIQEIRSKSNSNKLQGVCCVGWYCWSVQVSGLHKLQNDMGDGWYNQRTPDVRKSIRCSRFPGTNPQIPARHKRQKTNARDKDRIDFFLP